MAVVAWPPPTPPNTRANTTPEVDAHPADHNKIADALDTLIAKVPLGRVASGTSGATGNITVGQTNVDVVTITFTAVAGRRYRVSGFCLGLAGTAQNWSIFVADVANATLAPYALASVPATYFFPFYVWVEIPPGAAGARTYKIRANVNAGSGTIKHDTIASTLMVEDIGT